MADSSTSEFISPAQEGLVEAIGQSDVFLNFQQSLAQVAPVNRPLLLIGERGTGKELAAARIHFLSKRWDHPFIKLNCAALSPSVLESELFGHEAGAFTGATKRRLGRFEAADGGTLFLDEIGQMSLAIQEKLLRVIEYGTFERVGSSEPIRVDVRLVGATNVDLPALAEAGQFKLDLLDRLAFEVIHVPPLRMRQSDIEMLARHFARRMASELGHSQMPEFSHEAIASLIRHPWPGNIRELRNVVERAVLRNAGSRISAFDFDPFRAPFPVHLEKASSSHRTAPESPIPAPHPTPTQGSTPLDATQEPIDLQRAVDALELRLIHKALEASRFQQRQAATILGLSYHQFRGLYRKYKDRLPTG